MPLLCRKQNFSFSFNRLPRFTLARYFLPCWPFIQTSQVGDILLSSLSTFFCGLKPFWNLFCFIDLKELFSGPEHRILASAIFIPELAAFLVHHCLLYTSNHARYCVCGQEGLQFFLADGGTPQCFEGYSVGRHSNLRISET